jgi:hypothetical protein
MRIAVVSDTHMPRGARVLPADCVARLRAADLILHAGDLTGISFLDWLRELGPPIEAVHGNMDEPALQALLPETRVVEADGARIGMVHIPGPREGRTERLTALFPDCQVIVFGHTHLPERGRAGDVWLLNPGSPTERRRAPERTMLELVDLAPRLVPLGT